MFLALVSFAAGEVVRIPSSPFTLDLDSARWFPVYPFAGDAALELKGRPYGLPRAVVWWQPGLEPDLAAADLASYNSFLARSAIAAEGKPSPGTSVRGEHPNWGPVLLTPLNIPRAPGMLAVECRHALVSSAGGMLSVAVGNIRGNGSVQARLDDLLAAVRRPAASQSTFATGRVTADAGYELDLPAGWRALSATEAETVSVSRIGRGTHHDGHTFFNAVNPGRMPWLERQDEMLMCMALPALGESVDIVDPAVADFGAAAFFTRVDTMLAGGSIRRTFGSFTVGTNISIDADVPPQWLDAQSPKEVTVARFGDRDGYVWTGRGEIDGNKGDFTAVLLTYDDVDLTCVAGGRPESAPALRAAVMSLRVTDGANHPDQASLREQYYRTWPWRHPWLQIWTLGGASLVGSLLVLVALILRAMRVPRLGD